MWKKIKDFNYSVSDIGEIRNDKTKRILSPKKHPKGYLYTAISKDKKRYTFKIHRLVAEAFIKNPLNKPQVNHINGIKNDNRVENLEWNTNSENIRNGMKLFGKHYYSSMLGRTGEKSPFSKKILQFDINGNLISEYNCIREVCRINGWNHQNLILNLKNKTKIAYGFIWKYKYE